MKDAFFWVRRTHLFRADEYICAACKASCNKPYRVCPVCGAAKKKVRSSASWVDEAEGLSALLAEEW